MINTLKKYNTWKRLFDVFFAFAGIIIFSIPVFLLGIFIKLTSRGPMIHWSVRAGINNSTFRMAKLRTMKCDSPISDSRFFDKTDRYFIYSGKILRKSGIDELPQLYNILIGDMSFVGPRPVILKDEEVINKRIKKKIDTIKPGLIGLAQIEGRNDLSADKKVYYDELYFHNMSFLLDIKIIFFTNYYLLYENILKVKRREKLELSKVPVISKINQPEKIFSDVPDS